MEELLDCRISCCIVRNCINQHRIGGMVFYKERLYLGQLTNTFHRGDNHVEKGKLGVAHSNVFLYLIHLYLFLKLSQYFWICFNDLHQDKDEYFVVGRYGM